MSLDALPRCAKDCFEASLRDTLDCPSLAPECLCAPESQSKILADTALLLCLSSECSPEELIDALPGSAALCSGEKATPTQGRTGDKGGSAGEETRTRASAGPTGTAPDNPSETAPTGSSPDSSGGGGLSSGAKAGIAVGVVVGVLLSALLLFLLLRRRRSRLKASTNTAAIPDEKPPGVPGVPELGATGIFELGGRVVYPELETHPRNAPGPPEIHPHPTSAPHVAELDANPYAAPPTAAGAGR